MFPKGAQENNDVIVPANMLLPPEAVEVLAATFVAVTLVVKVAASLGPLVVKPWFSQLLEAKIGVDEKALLGDDWPLHKEEVLEGALFEEKKVADVAIDATNGTSTLSAFCELSDSESFDREPVVSGARLAGLQKEAQTFRYLTSFDPFQNIELDPLVSVTDGSEKAVDRTLLLYVCSNLSDTKVDWVTSGDWSHLTGSFAQKPERCPKFRRG
nr:hypothetical protein Iba_chr11bCG14770 [Ipomoea batatas]